MITGGRSATTTTFSADWFWRPSMAAMAARRLVSARPSARPSQHFQRIGHPTWDGAVRQATIPGSLPSRRVHRLSRFVESSALPPGRVQRRLPSPAGRSRFRSVRDICGWICRGSEVAGSSRASSVRRGRWTRRLPFLSRMTCGDGFTASSIEADPVWELAQRISRRVQAHRHPPAKSPSMTPNLRRALISVPAPVAATARLPVPAGACEGRWLSWVIASTTVRSAERPARVATAPMRRAPRWGPISPAPDGCASDGRLRCNRRPNHGRRAIPQRISVSRCHRWAALNSLLIRCRRSRPTFGV